MTPALFVEFSFEALRRPRSGIVDAGIARWTWRASAAAGAGALALERSIRMVLTDPAAIITHGAIHRSLASFRRPQ